MKALEQYKIVVRENPTSLLTNSRAVAAGFHPRKVRMKIQRYPWPWEGIDRKTEGERRREEGCSARSMAVPILHHFRNVCTPLIYSTKGEVSRSVTKENKSNALEPSRSIRPYRCRIIVNSERVKQLSLPRNSLVLMVR